MPPTATGYAINLQNVTKVYRRRVHALQGISMQVNRGEIFGLLGPNGAGKSTLVKIMVTVVRPTSATAPFSIAPSATRPRFDPSVISPRTIGFPNISPAGRSSNFSPRWPTLRAPLAGIARRNCSIWSE